MPTRRKIRPADYRRQNLGYELVRAAALGRTRRVESILEVLQRWSGRQEWINEALCAAADSGKADTLRVVLKAGADFEAVYHEAISWAALAGHRECVDVLAAHIFAPHLWRGKTRAEIEAYASQIYHDIEVWAVFPIEPDLLEQAGKIIAERGLTCWEHVRPAPPKIVVGVAKGRTV